MHYRNPMQNTKTPLPPFHIPLPNEPESGSELFRKKEKPLGLAAVFEFIRKHVTIEEIILIGLIILLLDESIEDEFLLIILAYVLLF